MSSAVRRVAHRYQCPFLTWSPPVLPQATRQPANRTGQGTQIRAPPRAPRPTYVLTALMGRRAQVTARCKIMRLTPLREYK
jgi:hypothetical protein